MPDTVIQQGPGIQQGGGEQVVRAICRMCHGGCGTLVTIKDGSVTKVVGDPENPVNRGKLCSKAGAPSIEQLYHEACEIAGNSDPLRGGFRVQF